MRRFLFAVVAGIVAHIATDLLRYQIDEHVGTEMRRDR